MEWNGAGIKPVGIAHPNKPTPTASCSPLFKLAVRSVGNDLTCLGGALPHLAIFQGVWDHSLGAIVARGHSPRGLGADRECFVGGVSRGGESGW